MLEIILTWAARQASANIHEGLPRRYEVRQELSTAVRGRIELKHLARRTPGKDFELLIRHSPLSENNPISRIVKWLLYEIGRRTRLIATQHICKRLLQDLGHVGDVTPSVSDVACIVLQPMESRWQPLLDLATLLIRQISPDPTRGGTNDTVAVLFTLHDIFERVLARVFRAGLGAHGLALQQPDRRLLEALPPASGQKMNLKPDFLIGSTANPTLTLVGDAKWKPMFSPTQEVALGEADAYQLTTYLVAFGASAGLIFCPLRSAPEGLPYLTADYSVRGLHSTLHIVGIHLPTLIATSPAGAATRQALCAHIAQRAAQLPA